MDEARFRILVLDGGGSKGMYTIGVLKELEKHFRQPLFRHFDLIYGTSTGSIIAALIALGWEMNDIEKKYLEVIPAVMSSSSSTGKSDELKKNADKIFGEQKFGAFKTDIGIVATNYEKRIPLIFKSNIRQAHGMMQSFDSGFGCTISEAVQCSCAAYPLFVKKDIATTNSGNITAVDGGFIANNPTLFALIDAHKAFKVEDHNLRLLSVGTGNYIEELPSWTMRIALRFNFAKFAMRIIECNTNTNEQLTKLLYPNLQITRVQDTFNDTSFKTSMLEYDAEKLVKMLLLGRDSFGRQEKEILQLFSD